MARCSCAGSSCGCLIQGGSGVVVSGQGTNAAPYIISTAPVPATIDVLVNGPLDLSDIGMAAVIRVFLQANVTSVVLPTNGAHVDLLFEQDGTGGRTVAFPAGVIWPGGTTPTITATAGARDWVTLIQAGGTWAGVVVANLS